MKKDQYVPTIRIGIIQSTDVVKFSCDDDFNFIDSSGRRLQSGKAFENYHFKINSSRPADIKYEIRVGIFKDEAQANQKTLALKEQGFETRVRRKGLKILFHDKTIDNSDFWVIIGNFSSYVDAENFLQDHAAFEDAVIVENISTKAEGNISLKGKTLGNCIRIIPVSDNALISVEDVPIGIEFHWQRKEALKYRGNLEVGFDNDGKLAAINEIDLENYLASVNSSEMTPDCPLGLLEAQTIAARSTVLATMGKHHYNADFHLCSDDHCQCYQGALREQDISRRAVDNTFGEFLMYGDDVCDARYSKICGGIIENYRNVWDERDVPYLVEDIDSDQKIDFPADTEDSARALIDARPPVFCNTNLHKLPEKLANLYSTQNLFRWEVVYDREELEALVAQKLNIDIGELKDIKPLSRGASGRLIYIELIGSKQNIKVGKELEIRRIFSKSHLYSSCFYVEKSVDNSGNVRQFTLKGGGWGHGVGLCQVGATVMALKGYSYQDILHHYFKKADISKLYLKKNSAN